jgi:PAS domain S-box-containing protein
MNTAQQADKRHFLYQWVMLSIGLLTLGGFIVFTQAKDHWRIDTQERERLTIQADIVEKNVVPQLLLANRVIDQILNDLPAWRAKNDGYKYGNRQLRVINDALIGIRPILVIQADGNVIASSNETLIGRNFAYRDYFKTAVKNPDPKILHVSAPFETVLNAFVFSLFRTITGPHGEFAGIVIVSVIPDYFSVLLDSVCYAPDMRATIVHGDGKLFLIAPSKMGVPGADLAKPGSFFARHRDSGKKANVFTGIAQVTGEYNIAALRTIQLTTPTMDKPLVVAVGRDPRVFFSPWRKTVYLQSALFGVITLFSTLGLFVMQRRRFDQLAERRRSDEKLRKLSQAVEQCPASIMTTDRNGDFEYVNPAFCKITGYTAEEIVGENPRVLKTETMSADGYRLLWETIIGGNTWQGEFCNKKKNGEPYWANACIAPVFDDKNAINHFVAIEEDITKRKQEEEAKAKLEGQLQQAQKMESIGRLAGGVAHDFNNMLTVILGHTNLALMKMDPTHPLYVSLEEIGKAAERSADLTRQLLAFARKQTISPKPLDLNDAVARVLNMLQRLIGEGIQLAWQPAVNLWPVKMDSSQVDQILANLCVNARDAIGDVGKITIETDNCTFYKDYCAIHLDTLPGEYVRLTVSDDGHGMSKDTLAQIFEPFFTTKGAGVGTGLGLATIYGIVKQNDGFINVYSEPGMGTTFTVYLPRHEVTSGQVQGEGSVGLVLRGQETILLVEDELAILNIATIMLENLGYTVIAANSPSEAIRLVTEHVGQIHLLMTDVVMPEMNGRDLANKLLSLYPQMKSLFMSGYTLNVIAHHGVLDEGINFIQKPFSLQDVALKVHEVLAQN